MIQIITYDTDKYKEYSEKKYKISALGEIQALDDFEICIIDLSIIYGDMMTHNRQMLIATEIY